ncbi:sensor histidine kinase [Actinorugispora endophytica]|uniref:histidine kinase n=1 Tax=Actinorugispora endophytica TaxID=1605990 RepID=A0A4R6UI84_9ACTN|nr:sensor histidine kinase [Actinorugispora endophytica]TDQ46152.1 signal transduction histidine kinase [Actinorugispora endophytica]
MHGGLSLLSDPRRSDRGGLVALDVLAAAGYTAVLLGTSLAQAPHAANAPRWVLVLVLASIGPPLAVRRLWPLPVFTVVMAGSVTAAVLGVLRDPFVAAAFALYPVALTTSGHRWPSASSVGLASAAVLLFGAFAGPPPHWSEDVGPLVLGAAVLSGAWAIGRGVRERRAYAARSAERITERAVVEERLRIARELHDVVAHGMSLIAVKAGVANHVIQTRPEEAADALRVIEATSRGALTEMRHLLGVLRSGTDERPADTGPAPGIGDLPGIAERAAPAGVRVDLDVRGADGLPGGTALAVYRIVQEAVTNVVRHAAPAHCRVEVVAAGGEVRIEVADDGPGGRVLPGGAGGYGLIGMRERAAAHNGTLSAGPRPGGGFGVRARLPYDPAPHADRAHGRTR